MSVPYPIITRGIWIPDPCFTWPIESYSYWDPGASIASYITPQSDTDGLGTGRYVSFEVANAGTSFDTGWDVTSAFSPRGVGAGPHTGTGVVGVHIIAKASGSWSTGTDVIGATVSSYDEDTNVEQTSGAITFDDSDGASFNVATHTDWTYLAGYATITLDADAVNYKVRLRFKDGTGTGPRYIHLRFCGLSMPVTDITHGYKDSLASWYDSQPQIASRRAMANGRGAHQQLVNLQCSALSADDMRLIRRIWQWNTGTPTDDITTGVVNRGQAAPAMFAIDRDDCKKVFYANIGGLQWGVSPLQSNYWGDSGNLYACALSLTERAE